MRTPVNGNYDQAEGVLIITEGASEHRVTGSVVDLLREAGRQMPSTSGTRRKRPVARPRFRIVFPDGCWISDKDLVDMIEDLEADVIGPGWVSRRVQHPIPEPK